VPHGTNCTARCDGRYKPSEVSLTCSFGVLNPPVFTCEAPSCTAPEVDFSDQSSCQEGPIIRHGGFCTPRCQLLYYPSGPARLKCEYGDFHPPTFKCYHSCDGTQPGLATNAREKHPFGGGSTSGKDTQGNHIPGMGTIALGNHRTYTGPVLWGSGLDLGPASLGDASAAAAEWRAGLAPERWRFRALGAAGPPTASGRRLAAELATRFSCRVCQVLVGVMWGDVAEPSSQVMGIPNLGALNRAAAAWRSTAGLWFQQGCKAMVQRDLLQAGWEITTVGCDGVGIVPVPRGQESRVSGEAVPDGMDGQGAVPAGKWCFYRDPAGLVATQPDLAEIYDPPRDALHRACEETIGAHAPRIAEFVAWQRNGTPARDRNEHLAQMACTQAACCSNSGVSGTAVAF